MDGKLWKENGNENIFEVCLVRWSGRKINGGAQVFSPQGHQKVSPKNGKKTWEGKYDGWMTKMSMCNLHIGLTLLLLLFFIFCFVSLWLNIVASLIAFCFTGCMSFFFFFGCVISWSCGMVLCFVFVFF